MNYYTPDEPIRADDTKLRSIAERMLSSSSISDREYMLSKYPVSYFIERLQGEVTELDKAAVQSYMTAEEVTLTIKELIAARKELETFERSLH